MKTAVEFIKEKLLSDEYWYENMTFDQIFEQAKEIENAQQQVLIQTCEDKEHSAYLYGHTVGFTKAMEKLQNTEVKQEEQ